MNREIFRAYNVCIRRGGNRELHDLSLSLFSGEVFGIHGNRYAGKTALIQLLTGVIQPDSGMVEFHIPNQKEGISCISREPMLISEMKVWENFQIICARQRLLRWASAANTRNMLRLMMERYDIHLDPDARAETLSPIQCVILEILAAKYRGTRLILMDISGIEGTATEFYALKSLLHLIKQEGITFLIFGHQNTRLYPLSDRIGILHKGRIIQVFSTAEVSVGELTAAVYNLYSNPRLYSRAGGEGEPALKIEDLDVGLHSPVSFQVNAGELVALFCPAMDLYPVLNTRLNAGAQKTGGVCFVDTPQLEWVIREMSPLENICLGLKDRNGRPLLRSASIRGAIEQDFDEWYEQKGLLQAKNSTALRQRERIALNLFRLRLINPRVIICNDISTYNDIVTYHMVMDALAAMTENGTAVCITTNTMSMGSSISWYVVLRDE